MGGRQTSARILGRDVDTNRVNRALVSLIPLPLMFVLAACASSAAGSSDQEDLSIDDLVHQSVEDVESYWKERASLTLDVPVQEVDVVECDSVEFDEDPAAACDDQIQWVADRMDEIRERGGSAAVTSVIAHEIGHIAQQTVERIYPSGMESEASADCSVGAYLASTGMDREAAIEAFSAAADVSAEWRAPYVEHGWSLTDNPIECLDFVG